MMAMYNETLITMYAGFHPDSYWDEADVLKAKGFVRETGLLESNDTPRTMSDITDTPRSMNGSDEKKCDAASSDDLPLPQSVEDESLKTLRDMIEMQAAKIKELQERMHGRENASN
jgi:hypothetical protein